MQKLIHQCPCCCGKLHIATLQCPDCGMELKKEFAINTFDTLGSQEHDFLLAFLRNRGNLKNVQIELGISYPTAKKKLDDLLIALGLEDIEMESFEEEIDMRNLFVNRHSTKASEIIKAKLKENGGRVIVRTVTGLPCEICAAPDGVSFVSPKLPIKPAYEFAIFDVIVDLLIRNDGRARKGNGRNHKFGHAECDENTVVGAVAVARSGGKVRPGDSVFDPVFVLAAVLEWAEIANNGRGELTLTQSYRSKI